EDFHIAGAAAKISGETVADVGFSWFRISFEQIDGCENHPRSTNTTLRAAVFDKCLLHGVQLIAVGDALDRGDAGAGNLRYRNETRVHDVAVQADGARPALAFATTFFRAGQTQFFTKHIEQSSHGKHF